MTRDPKPAAVVTFRELMRAVNSPRVAPDLRRRGLRPGLARGATAIGRADRLGGEAPSGRDYDEGFVEPFGEATLYAKGQDEQAPIHPHRAPAGVALVDLQIPSSEPSQADLEVLGEVACSNDAEENGHAGPDPVSHPAPLGSLHQLVLDKSTMQQMLGMEPGLEADDHRALALYSVLGRATHTSVDRGGNIWTRITIPAWRLAAMQDRTNQYHSKHYSGLGFLGDHQRLFPRFEATGWGYKDDRYPRQVGVHGVPADVLEVIDEDLSRPFADIEAPVYALSLNPAANQRTGRAAQAMADERERARATADYLCAAAICNPVQARLAALLNSAASNQFSRLAKTNAQLAIDAARTEPDRLLRLRALAQVRLVQVQPQPFYAPSAAGRTTRLFATGSSLVTLPRRVRKAFMAGCIDFDLASAHLAILATVLEVPELASWLGRPGERRAAWPAVFDAAGLGHVMPGHPDYDVVKGDLKKAVYSLAYGMSRYGLLWTISRSLSTEAARAFLADPVVEALLHKRDEVLSTLHIFGLRDAFGVTRYAEGETPAARQKSSRSVLSLVAQSYELALLEPVVDAAVAEAAKARPDFSIVAWQHDGFTVAARRNPDRLVRRFQRLVDARALDLGIPTGLEAERL